MATNKAAACRGVMGSKLGKTTKTHLKGVGKHFGLENAVNATNPPEGKARPDLSISPFIPNERPPEPTRNDSPESYKSQRIAWLRDRARSASALNNLGDV